MKPLEKIRLKPKDREIIQNHVMSSVKKLNKELKIKFEFARIEYDEFCNNLMRFELDEITILDIGEDKAWKRYKKLKKSENIDQMEFYASFSSTNGIKIVIYFSRDNYKKLLRYEKLKTL